MNQDPTPKVEKIEKPKWGWASNQRGQLVITLNIAGAVLHLSPDVATEVLQDGINNLNNMPKEGNEWWIFMKDEAQKFLVIIKN